MDIRLTNTLSRKKEVFTPQDPKRVTLYVCGPTVYSIAHIGNFRPVVAFDVLFRLLRTVYGEKHVVYAANITDIDDKIIAASLKSGEPIKAITEKYEALYLADSASLNALPPTFRPHATEHMDEMIAMMRTLEDKGHAYQTRSGLLFNVPSMRDYGKLSRRDRDEMIAGARVDIASDKIDPADFSLWKAAKPDEPEDAQWDSPWGKGRPGWHIECSAMIAGTLGETIDIHGGGIDLQFPHHENEIAQSECTHGVQLARYWLHNGFVDFGAEKMSKSLGNVLTVHELLETHRGETLRLALMSAHYRQPLDWTEALLEQSKTTLDRAYGALRRVWDVGYGAATDAGVINALKDDLNTPQALAEFARLANEANRAADQADEAAMISAKANLLTAGDLLGLLQSSPRDWEKGADADDTARIDAAVQARIDARNAKNWAEADRIRDTLAAEGVEIMDGPNGSTWRKV
ncbi:MAG: cysteine--tRNA ligase [Pseudomonadota bacterium]